MNVLIAEDEPLAADRLAALLKECEPALTIKDQVDTVEGIVQFYNSGNGIDLLMLDIQLADGKSFEVFNKVDIKTPVIFTTAYDQFAIQAFRHLSIDYLLKPIQKEDLQRAMDKFKLLSKPNSLTSEELRSLNDLIRKTSQTYRERFLIKAGNKLHFRHVNEAAYFYADGKATYLVTKKENRKHLIDHTLEELETSLDPNQFFRINRKFIIHIESIAEVKGLISSRLELKLTLPCDQDLSVSRDKAKAFKNWLDR